MKKITFQAPASSSPSNNPVVGSFCLHRLPPSCYPPHFSCRKTQIQDQGHTALMCQVLPLSCFCLNSEWYLHMGVQTLHLSIPNSLCEAQLLSTSLWPVLRWPSWGGSSESHSCLHVALVGKRREGRLRHDSMDKSQEVVLLSRAWC